MKKTLQDQYLLIKEGKGHKGVFLAEAKRQFPNIVRNAATFEEAAASLKTKNIISENVIGLSAIAGYEPKKKESYETAFENFLAEAAKKKENEDEKVKAEEKKVSKKVEEDASHNFDRKDDKNLDNLIFDQVMTGYYAELKDPKNADKTMHELKDIVMKNLAKDPIHYTKDGQFGVKGLGYTTEAPGLGEPKEAKGKYKSSGYGDLNEGKNYPDFITGEMEGEPIRIDGQDLYDMLMSGLKNSTTPESFIKYVEYGVTDETSRISNEDKQKLVNWYNKNKNASIDESKLRKAIRSIINEELEEIININTKNTKGGGGKRYIPSEVFVPQSIIDKFNFSNPGENAPSRQESMQIPHIKFGMINGNSIMLVSDFLYNAINGLERGRTSREKEVGKNELEKLISTLDPMARAMIKKNMEPKLAMNNYHVVNMPIEREKGVGVKIPLGKEELEELMLREFVGDAIRQELKEGVEKELAAINKEAEHEIIASKLEKVQALIDKKQSQLTKLDEDEDMKDLTDKKKVKEIEKDIKSLEKAKVKLEKMMGKGKGKKKEVIDETEDELAAEYIEDADERQDDGESIDSILSNYDNLSYDDKVDLGDELEDREEY
jgi:hypothetical protein